jgi:CPA2 family monovalent cation:H+ antiporter-2
MDELTYLEDLLIILAVAVTVVVIFHKLRLPAIAGFIFSGALVGPQGLALINDAKHVNVLAEIGVALLLFGIGLELSLKKLKRFWRLVIAGGLLQVGLSIITAIAICQLFGLSGNASLFVGFIVALSSTAIVLRGMQERGEVDAPHGSLILGILVFQDLIVVPMMLVIPLLVGAELNLESFAVMTGKSLGIIAAVLVLAVLVLPRVLKTVAKTRQRRLFILSVFVVCLGTAWLVTHSGVSLAIGAFLAGLVVAGSEYRHQAMADMIAFREVFSSLFFISVGMLLLPAAIADNFGSIILLLAVILVGKAVIVFVATAILRMPLRACVIAALSLAQIGEFSFILLYEVRDTGLLNSSLGNNLLSVAILSMFVTPFAMSFGPKLATGLGRFDRLKRYVAVNSAEEASDIVCKMCDHVIVAGYGFAGRELARILHERKIPYIIIDANIEKVHEATARSQHAVYGDITSEEVLNQLGIETARELVLLINDPIAAEQTVRAARSLTSKLFITVRTAHLLDIEPLRRVGANEIIPAEREAAVQVATQVLRRCQLDSNAIEGHAVNIRGHSETETG